MVFATQNAEIVACILSFRKSRHMPNLESTSKYSFSPYLGGDDGVVSMRMQVILDSLFARPCVAPIWGGKKGVFKDYTRKPVPFANWAPSWILRRALPGTGGPAQKFATSPFVNYRSPRSSASRIIQNGSHEKRPPGFLAEVKLQCLQVGYFSPGVGVYFLSILASLTRVNYTKLDVKPSHLNLLWMED